MKILFFDGNCPMCHSWVKRILRWDKQKIFRFSPLEGPEAKRLLSPLLPNYIEEDTIVFYDEGKVYLRSDAALKIFSQLQFPFTLLGPGYLVPKKIRDGIYRWVANRRYKFGERFESCPIPPVAWKDRFI
jgi:predicted DCC family thiol-disulfide oxidoreductase YuxK